MYEIEKGIPLPKRKNIKNPGLAGVARKMEIGDSFFISVENPEDRAKVQRHFSALLTPKFGYGRFSIRQVEGGIRVWKIEEAGK